MAETGFFAVKNLTLVLRWIMLQISQQLWQVEVDGGIVVPMSCARGSLLCTQSADDCHVCRNEHSRVP